MRWQHALVDMAYSLYYSRFRDYCKSIDLTVHVTSDEKGEEWVQPCIWNGIRRPCYLFARKFYPETLDKLVMLLNF
ncbi:hypothetical protein CRYUN_Cryun11dG0053500 [Craigia yunnanensis]